MLVQNQDDSADELVILGMGADPEPQQTVGSLDRKRAIMQSYPRRPETTNLLEAERRVLMVDLQEFERLVGKLLNLDGKRSVAGLEIGRGVVIQSLED